MKRSVDTGMEFRTTMAQSIESLIDQRNFAGVVRYYEVNRDVIENSGTESAGSMLHHVAIAYASLSNYPIALRVARAAQHMEAGNGDCLNLAEIFMTVAGILRDIGKWQEAEKVFRDAESVFRRNDCLEGQSRALNLLAGLFFKQNNFTEALRILLQALEIARKLKDKKKLAYMMGNVGRIYTFTGNLAEARKHLLLNIELSTELGDDIETSRAYLSLSYVEIQQGNNDKSHQLLDKAKGMIAVNGNRKDELIHLTYLGELLYRTSKFDESRNVLNRAFKLATTISRGTAMEARIRRHLAELAVRMGDYRRASQMVSSALPIMEKNSVLAEMGALYKIKGQIADARGKAADGETFFSRAFDLLDKSGVRLEKADALAAAGSSNLFSPKRRMTFLFRVEEFFTVNSLENRLKEIGRLIEEQNWSGSPAFATVSDSLPAGQNDAEFLTSCAEIKRFMSQIEAIGRTDIPVLLTGETGVGKDHLARYFHRIVRPNGPFRAINCASLPETLLESELFGFKKGAFTGADADKQGLFVASNGGVLFLDEIGDMPLSLQSKLLGVLENRRLLPLGSVDEITLDIKLLAATNRNLEEMVEDGSFRRDLFYRLSGIVFRIPALRERKEDIPLLLHHFLKKSRLAEVSDQLPTELIHQFVCYDWPGNTRELANKVKRLEVAAELIAEGDLVELTRSLFAIEKPSMASGLVEQVEAFERKLLVEALVAAGGNKSEAARILGIHEATVRTKLKRYDISNVRPN